MADSKILLLCDEAVRHIGTVDDHIMAFKRYSRSRVVVVDSRAAPSIDLDLELFDAVVLHYSLVISMKSFISPAFFQRLAALKRPKILFIQDEYRWVDRTSAAIRDLGISVVFTVVNRDAIRQIYKGPWFDNVRFEETLTGFVPEALLERPVPDYAARAIDVSYRARKVPSWLGEFGQEKWVIGEKFSADSARYGLKCDIAMTESSRIYGDAWIDFVANSKAVLGTESGASFIDFAGGIQREVEAYERQHPDAPFSDVQQRYLAGDGQIVIHVISPRCFEAAALKTLMIMYPGTYSGALEAGRHYLALARDHSNMDEVVSTIRDPAKAEKIIRAAYHEVANSGAWTFKAFVAHFDAVLFEELARFATIGQANGCRQTAQPPQSVIEQKFSDLEVQSQQRTRARKRAMAWAMRLYKWSGTLGNLTRKLLPESLANRVTRGCVSLADVFKPLIIRFLFGGSG